jgi:hypothetical protein
MEFLIVQDAKMGDFPVLKCNIRRNNEAAGGEMEVTTW